MVRASSRWVPWTVLLSPASKAREFGSVLFRLVWFAMLALSLIAPAAGIHYRNQWQHRVWEPFDLVGLRYYSPDGLALRLDWPISEEARRTGIARGDRILAIDGRTAPEAISDVARVAEQLSGAEGSTVAVRTQSPTGAVRNHVLTRTTAHQDDLVGRVGMRRGIRRAVSIGLGLLPNYLLVAAAALLFLRRPRDHVAALLSLCFLMIASYLFMSTFVYAVLNLTWISDLLSIVGWLGLVLVLLRFPDGRFIPQWTRWVALLLIPVGIALFFYLISGPLADVVYVALLAVGVTSLVTRYRRLPAGTEQQQIRWAIFGFTSGVALIAVAVSIFQAIDQLDLGPAREVWTGLFANLVASASIACLALGLLVSLLRYRLYDADTVISRSAGYAVMTLAAGAVFAGSAKALEALFEANFGGDARALAGGAGAALAALLVTPAHNRIHAWAERRFQKALLHLRRDLPECVNDLRETASLSELLDEVLDRITAGVRASRAAIAIGGHIMALRQVSLEEAEQWLAGATLGSGGTALDCERSDPLFPMQIPLRVAHRNAIEPVGWVLLGPRPDGSFYGKDEREALAEIADPIARAVKIVLVREARQQAFEAQIRVLQGEMADLAKRFDLIARPSMPPALS